MRTEPAASLTDYTVFIYGPPKIGKTRLASEWPNSVFLATEPQGLKAVECDAFPITNWRQFRGSVSALVEDFAGKYQTVIVDTVDLAYKFCLDYCCEVHGFEHPSDEGWGKGWEIVANELLNQILRLFNGGFLPIFISHSKKTEVKTAWETRTIIEPTLSNTGRRVILPIVDIILLMEPKSIVKKGRRRIVRTVTCSPAPDREAGDRTGFLGSKPLVVREGEGYETLSAVFNENVKAETKKRKEKKRKKKQTS